MKIIYNATIKVSIMIQKLKACGALIALLLTGPLPNLNAQVTGQMATDKGWENIPDAITEQVAVSTASKYRPYQSKPSENPDVTTWVQIGLGKQFPIDNVKLYPATGMFGNGAGFPLRFRIECDNDSLFQTPKMIADRTASDYPSPGNHVTEFRTEANQARFVRITATRLRTMARSFGRSAAGNTYVLTLYKVDVISNGRNIAEGCKVSADPVYGNENDLQQLIRLPRPQGEYIITDNIENVIPESEWKPVANSAKTPLSGVTLKNGVFFAAMKNNTEYLLNSFSVDELLRQFYEKAGKPVPPNLPDPQRFWEEQLAGSNAGRFLMGAGNTLRWMENEELRSRMNSIVDGIESCSEPNGYIMAYPDSTIFESERGAYTRSWTTHGLLEAGYSGNTKAFELLRGYYDWYNQCKYLPRLLRGAGQGGQGMVANTRMYFSPLGKAADIQVLQRYFQETYWLTQLADRDVDAVWQYPYDRPHCYLLTNLEAYLDIYRATGNPLYLDAILGGWDLFHDNWENIGGSISIIESETIPPKSNYLYDKLGETCGSAFWILLNQRLHNLFPEEEKYMTEIEKSIYNVILANQDGSSGIRYHTMLLGVKEPGTSINTCCEGQGTRILGSLPEYIYSVAPDGIYVNLFEPSEIECNVEGNDIQLSMETEFPFKPEVKILVSTVKSSRMNIRIRIPSWVSDDVSVAINGQPTAIGIKGSYLALNREWSEGDEITFILPVKIKMTPYVGTDEIPNHGKRYAFEYGPILMAVTGNGDLPIQLNVENIDRSLREKPGQPLHFELVGSRSFGSPSSIELMPYWQIDNQCFSCFPAIE